MTFHGWPPEALHFYRGLEADNSKAFWTEHKDVYDTCVLAPMTALLEDLFEEFGGAKIFRPYRDVRFSADKSPYKTAIGALFVEGGYVQLSASGLAAGAGYHQMETDQLARFREAVAQDASGEDLASLLSVLRRKRIDLFVGESLKTAPRGYPGDHPRLDLLRRKDLAAWKQWPSAPWLATTGAKNRVAEFFRSAEPLNDWLDQFVGPSTKSHAR